MVWLDNSRILAIFAVVLLHVSAGVVLGNDMGAALMEQVKLTVNKGVQHYQHRICTTS